MKTTTENMFIIDVDNVLTLSESYDVEMIQMHTEFVNENNKRKKCDSLDLGSHHKMNRKMGYISNVNDAKKLLERIYENS